MDWMLLAFFVLIGGGAALLLIGPMLLLAPRDPATGKRQLRSVWKEPGGDVPFSGAGDGGGGSCD